MVSQTNLSMVSRRGICVVALSVLFCASDLSGACAQDTFLDGGADLPAAARNARISFSRPREIPETHTVHQGDTLWDITQRYYGDPYEWPRIWSYNPEITNPHWVYPEGIVRLRLPGMPTTVAVRASHFSRSAPRPQSGSLFVSDDGYLDHEALHRAGRVMNSPEDHMMLAPSDLAYVSFADSPQEFVPSGELAIFRYLDPDQHTPASGGAMVRILGSVRVESYDRDRRVAVVRILDALDPVERGLLIADAPRQYRMVELQPATADVETTIVATLNPSILIGQSVMVYIPKGSEDGVRVGNEFVVPRNVDRWIESLYANPTSIGATEEVRNMDHLPEELVATGRAVFVQPHSTAIWITQTTEELEIGDPLVMRRPH